MTSFASPRTDRQVASSARNDGRRTEPEAGGQLARAGALAVLATLLVLFAGSAWVLTLGSTYEASVDVLVTPSAGASDTDAAALFDSLSRGQVPATAAEIYRQRQWRGDRVGSIEAGVVTPSAVIQVVARASSATEAQELVQAVVVAADPTINRALDPYQVSRLGSGPPAATRVGLSRPLRLGLVVLAALVVGGAVLRAVHPRPKLLIT